MRGTLRSPTARWEDWPDGSGHDDVLVALAQEDRREFAALYRRYIDPVHKYCYRRLGSREAAEDATSVIFTKAFIALPSYRAGSFRSWLFAIAYHVITDDLRARRMVAELEAAQDIEDDTLSPEALVMAAEAQVTVGHLLDQLTPGQRRVVELRLAGLTGREIATVLGCSLGAVKIAQVRGYSTLRSMLAETPGKAVRCDHE